jgi:5-methylcytosine-specific restriction endonuclease McrA
LSNLQGLCHAHHNEKGAKDKEKYKETMWAFNEAHFYFQSLCKGWKTTSRWAFEN